MSIENPNAAAMDATKKAVSQFKDEEQAGIVQAVIKDLKDHGKVVDGDWSAIPLPPGYGTAPQTAPSSGLAPPPENMAPVSQRSPRASL